MISTPTAAPSRDTLTLAQVYHPSRRLRHHGHNSSTPCYTSPPPVATAGMIGTPTISPFHDITTCSQLYHPVRQTTRNGVNSSFIRQGLKDCVTLSCSVSSSDMEQILQEIQNDIGNTNEDDWSFNSSLPLNANSPKVGLGSAEDVGDYACNGIRYTESSTSACNGIRYTRRWANGRPQNSGGPFGLLENNPTEDRLSESVEETSPQPPLIMVMGRSWSPSIYGAVRLLGNTVDVAWRMAFIHPLTFI